MPVMPMGEDAKFFTDGQAYERLMGRWSRIAAETFLHWLDAPKNLNWLDVGCGNGAFTEELIARCAPAAISAIDPSDEQLAYARTRPSVKMTEFRVGDGENLPFDDGTFDVAVMALVISFLRDPNKAAAEMARVVRPDGWTRFISHWNQWVRLPCAHPILRCQNRMPCEACGKRLGLNLSVSKLLIPT
jgi:ubiquinone/menaquinone biosynthesis C-methylase UbiE